MVVPDDDDLNRNTVVDDVEFDHLEELDLTRFPRKPITRPDRPSSALHQRPRHDRPSSALHQKRSPEMPCVAISFSQRQPLPAWSTPVLMDPVKETARKQARQQLLHSLSARLGACVRSQAPGSFIVGGSSSSTASVEPRASCRASHIAGRAATAAARLRADAGCIVQSKKKRETKTGIRQGCSALEARRPSSIGHDVHSRRGVCASRAQEVNTHGGESFDGYIRTHFDSGWDSGSLKASLDSDHEGMSCRDVDAETQYLEMPPAPQNTFQGPCLLAQSTRRSLRNKESEPMSAFLEKLGESAIVPENAQTVIYDRKTRKKTSHADDDDSQHPSSSQRSNKRRMAMLDAERNIPDTSLDTFNLIGEQGGDIGSCKANGEQRHTAAASAHSIFDAAASVTKRGRADASLAGRTKAEGAPGAGQHSKAFIRALRATEDFLLKGAAEEDSCDEAHGGKETISHYLRLAAAQKFLRLWREKKKCRELIKVQRSPSHSFAEDNSKSSEIVQPMLNVVSDKVGDHNDTATLAATPKETTPHQHGTDFNSIDTGETAAKRKYTEDILPDEAAAGVVGTDKFATEFCTSQGLRHDANQLFAASDAGPSIEAECIVAEISADRTMQLGAKCTSLTFAGHALGKHINLKTPGAALQEAGSMRDEVWDGDNDNHDSGYFHEGGNRDGDNDDVYAGHDFCDADDVGVNHDGDEQTIGIHMRSSVRVGETLTTEPQVGTQLADEIAYHDTLESRSVETKCLEGRAAAPPLEVVEHTSNDLSSAHPIGESEHLDAERHVSSAIVNLGSQSDGSSPEICAARTDSLADEPDEGEPDDLGVGEYAHVLPGEHVLQGYSSKVTAELAGFVVEEVAKSAGVEQLESEAHGPPSAKCNTWHAGSATNEQGGEDTEIELATVGSLYEGPLVLEQRTATLVEVERGLAEEGATRISANCFETVEANDRAIASSAANSALTQALPADELATSDPEGWLAAEKEEATATIMKIEQNTGVASASLLEEQLGASDAVGLAAVEEVGEAENIDPEWYEAEESFEDLSAKPTSQASIVSREEGSANEQTELFAAHVPNVEQQALEVDAAAMLQTQGSLLQDGPEQLEALETIPGDEGSTDDARDKFAAIASQALEEAMARSSDERLANDLFSAGQLAVTCAASTVTAADELAPGRNADAVQSMTLVVDALTKHTAELLVEGAAAASIAVDRLACEQDHSSIGTELPATEYLQIEQPIVEGDADASADEQGGLANNKFNQVEIECVERLNECVNPEHQRTADGQEIDKMEAEQVPADLFRTEQLAEDPVVVACTSIEGSAAEKHAINTEHASPVQAAPVIRTQETATSPAISSFVLAASLAANPENTRLVADVLGVHVVEVSEECGFQAEGSPSGNKAGERMPEFCETNCQASDQVVLVKSEAEELVAKGQNHCMDSHSDAAATPRDHVETLVADGTAAALSSESDRETGDENAKDTESEHFTADLFCAQPDEAALVEASRSLVEEDANPGEAVLVEGPRCDADAKQTQIGQPDIVEAVDETKREQLVVNLFEMEQLDSERSLTLRLEVEAEEPAVAEIIAPEGDADVEETTVQRETGASSEADMPAGGEAEGKNLTPPAVRVFPVEKLVTEHEPVSGSSMHAERLPVEIESSNADSERMERCASDEEIQEAACELTAAEEEGKHSDAEHMEVPEALVPVDESVEAQKLPLREVFATVCGAEQGGSVVAISSMPAETPDSEGDPGMDRGCSERNCGDSAEALILPRQHTTPVTLPPDVHYAKEATSSHSGDWSSQMETPGVDVMSAHSGDWSEPEAAGEGVASEKGSGLDDDQRSGHWSDEGEHEHEIDDDIEYSGEWSVENDATCAQDVKRAPLDDDEYSGDWSNDDAE
eukprot:TRINITY_DN3772_c0_g1_i1.p1 TRINITY_DN3772_c0_g1~~TRINITY_DN3772_c0_g1_i1.p1  ORF type:complete len:1882 (-),score=409.48 TRINITY_DN3772_c0_g1_i1:406-6051(-)